MSWVSSFLKHNRDFIGNAMKNIAPIAAFTPLGALGAGAIGALGRGIQHGANLGNIVKTGATDAAIGGGAHAGLNALRSAFVPGSSPAATAGGFVSGQAGSGGGYMSDAAVQAGRAGASAGAGMSSGLSGLASSLGSGVRSVGQFAKDYPQLFAGGLTGLGQIGSMNAENGLRHAQMDSINQQTHMSQYELQAQQQRAQALAPLLQALMGRMQQTNIAPNPYGH